MAEPIDLTGKVFGLLTVTKRAEKQGRYIAWYCDCECGTTDFIARGSDLKQKRVKSCGCKTIKEFELELEEEKKAKEKAKEEAKKLSKQEKNDWDELYQYVRSNVMGYDENQSLSSTMVLRLKGLLTNKFIESKSVKSTANYSYKVILNSFKFSLSDIQRALRTNNFVDENHKFNYILKIVEKNINTVYLRMRNAQQAKEEAKNTMVEIPTHTGAEFKPKEKKKDKFADLW